MLYSFFYSQINKFFKVFVIHSFLLTKNKLFLKVLAEMDRLFSYTSSNDLQDPDPGRKFRIRQKRSGSGRIRISNTASHNSSTNGGTNSFQENHVLKNIHNSPH
jgi:hypothetical protein